MEDALEERGVRVGNSSMKTLSTLHLLAQRERVFKEPYSGQHQWMMQVKACLKSHIVGNTSG